MAKNETPPFVENAHEAAIQRRMEAGLNREDAVRIQRQQFEADAARAAKSEPKEPKNAKEKTQDKK